MTLILNSPLASLKVQRKEIEDHSLSTVFGNSTAENLCQRLMNRSLSTLDQAYHLGELRQ